ncbi:MAG: YihA family ribosome biogenesis GTP-binding protein [Alphaproteobacteria bacterium]|nr:MAG: YihA family ribosome biogenesis GTP-binding protein [Alphaproteobacteria bacterium]
MNELTEEEKAGKLEEERLERGRLLFSQRSEFMLGVVAMEHLPAPDRVEISFAGRSNVGKSSLLNALTDQKGLARTSNTPGRTQEVNFFSLGTVGEDALYLSDLPGYGYAKVSRSLVKEWTKLLRQYLRGRPNLRRAFVLVDSRHGIKESDLEIMTMLDECAVSYQIVLTKVDKLKKNELVKVLAKTQAAIAKKVAAHPVIISTSAAKGEGIAELRAAIADLVYGN